MARTAIRKTPSKRAVRKGRSAPRHGDKQASKRASKPALKTVAKLASKRVSRRGAGADSNAIESVLAAFAHDIRTPLTGILALGDLLATSGLAERERRWVASIKDAAEHLAELTTLIVEGARAGAGRLPSRNEIFDLPRLVAAVVASFAARAEAKNLACKTDIAAGLPQRVTGDPAQLRTALENLIANAVKFTERGEVGLTAAAAPRARGKLLLTFAVTDSGIGMSAAEIRRLFRPFAQANRDIVQRFGGAGLGLVQVRRLAKAMHGDLKVESTPGRGSTFRLSVVVDHAAADDSGKQELGAGISRAAVGIHVLCVEDNPFGRVVMNAILGELGHRVDFAGSGESAIEAVAHGAYDAVLMDITLAGIDGFEATRRIRALPGPASLVPVIGTSGRSEPADIAAARAAGMQAYLTKPLSPRMLAETLSRWRRGSTGESQQEA
jgi:two-component system, sensor histidine kinase